MATLFDTNIWLAALFAAHPFHLRAKNALLKTTPEAPAVFCRATQQSFVRLCSTPALLKIYELPRFTNNDALTALDLFQASPQVGFLDEPEGTCELWRSLAGRETASPKVWMDAYLAAFAISGGLNFVTIDRDFKSYTNQGLKLTLI